MRKPFLALLALLANPAFGADAIEFNRDIRPLIADHCFHCHGPDPGTRKAGLRLDTEAGFFAPRVDKKGNEEPPTIIKGQPDKSSLFQRMISKDEDEIMPPPETHKPLKPEQIALVRRWIEQGAPWQPHWSLVPPRKAALPVVADAGWNAHPVDRFVRARLDAAGLRPAEEADARTLLRRLSLDLTGLPPTPEFLARHLPKDGARLTDAAIGAVIDELSALPAYGEHRARYWLDAARYGDSHGLHFDNPREMWPYRDWVVKAYNANQRFDQFTLEQLAGDLLPNPTESQLIATGLQRCNVTTNEGGTIAEENLANYAADRVQTVGWVYLGLTTNCAQCHDHKFDPITQKDFYSLAAFFRNTTQKALDGNTKDGNGPILHVPTDADRPRWQALPAEIQAATQATQTARAAAETAFEKWLATAKPADLDADLPTKDLLARFGLDEGQGVPAGAKATGPLTWQQNGRAVAAPVFRKDATLELGDVGDFRTKQPFTVSTWVRGPKTDAVVTLAARMDDARGSRGWSLFQAGRTVGLYLVANWPEDALQVVTAKSVVKPDTWQHVVLSYDGSGKAAGVRIYVDGQRAETKTVVDKLKSDVRAETPTRLGQRSQREVFENGSLQDVRFYGRALTETEASALAKVPTLRGILAAKPDAKQKEMLREHYLATRNPAFREAGQKLARLMAEQKAIRDRSPITHIQEERKDRMPMANILLRGAYDKPGDKVEAAVPAALGKLAADAPKNRLGLARWIISPENPLTARVTVNRMWQELFGTGLVKTSEDFGIMGALPSHPELLDWLAVDFRENGWDVKRFYRLILTSRTYRQAAVITPEKLEKDRDNTLFSRGPRFRMDAEMIRDYALAASGTLSPRMGGPGTKPYQPENIWEVVGVGIQPYRQDKGENLYRRSVYNYWRRMAPPASLELFNAPSREVSCVRRDRTNTPLQALVMMNDPQYVEASRQLAQRTLQAGARTAASLGDAGLLDAAAVRLLCRPLRDEEKAVLVQGLARFRAHYQARPADAEALLKVGDAPADPSVPKTELAAWTMVCSQLLNLDEVLNK